MDLTIQQAAQRLNVSQPYLIRLLKEKKISFHMVGWYQRIRLVDVLGYMESRSQKSKIILRTLIEEGQDLDGDVNCLP